MPRSERAIPLLGRGRELEELVGAAAGWGDPAEIVAVEAIADGILPEWPDLSRGARHSFVGRLDRS